MGGSLNFELFGGGGFDFMDGPEFIIWYLGLASFLY